MSHSSLHLSLLQRRTPQALTLLLAICIAWGGVAAGSFQYDDFMNVLLDPATTNVDALVDRLFGGIRPITRMSYAASSLWSGDWAGGWLLVNLALHVISVVAVAGIVRLRSRDPLAAYFAALCFAVIPSHAAVIAYVSGRSNGLAACLLLLALLIHEYGVAKQRQRTATIGAVTVFTLACTARETAVVFPLLLLLWEATRPSQHGVRGVARECARRVAPYLIAAIAVTGALLACVPRYSDLLDFSFATYSPSAALLNNLGALPLTLSLLVRPWALSIEHAVQMDAGQVAIGAGFLLVMMIVAVRVRRAAPLLTLALLWPLLALLPTHSFIARLDPVSEGPLYLAAVGPAIAIGQVLARWLCACRSRAGTAGLGMALTIAIALCIWRTTVWASPVRLWEEAAASAPQSSRAWTNLGVAHLTADHPEAARAALRHSLAVDPTNALAMFNLEMIAAINTDSPSASERNPS